MVLGRAGAILAAYPFSATIGRQTLARIRDGVECILNANRCVEVIHSACCLEELHEAGIQVDAVILDLHLEDGRTTASTISAVASRYPVLIVSAWARRGDLLTAIQAGASGYITGNASGDAIIEAVETIVTGGLYLSSPVTGMTGADIPAAESAGSRGRSPGGSGRLCSGSPKVSHKPRLPTGWASARRRSIPTSSGSAARSVQATRPTSSVRPSGWATWTPASINQRDGSPHATTGQQRDSQITGGPDRCPHA